MNADLKTELRIRELLELMRMENNAAERETVHSDGWLYDHAQVVREYREEIDGLLNPPNPNAVSDRREG